MPIYEYKCQDCGELIEVMQRMSDDPLTTCEACGGTLKKQISAPAFQFKGSGWYVTDYADKGKKGGGDSGSTGSGSSDGSSDSGSKDSGSKDSGGESKTKESKGGGEASKKPA
jgi:putative FmdB family regulatory protein